jgi:hypothetical protein
MSPTNLWKNPTASFKSDAIIASFETLSALAAYILAPFSKL